MELIQVDKIFTLQMLSWLKNGHEWKIAGGKSGLTLGQKLVEIEKIFEISSIYKIVRNDNLLGCFSVVRTDIDKAVFHTYICKKYRNKSYGYFAVKELLNKIFFEWNYSEVRTLASGKAREYLDRWSIFENEHKKISTYNVYKITKENYASYSSNRLDRNRRSGYLQFR